jgi:hypothetical protein
LPNDRRPTLDFTINAGKKLLESWPESKVIFAHQKLDGTSNRLDAPPVKLVRPNRARRFATNREFVKNEKIRSMAYGHSARGASAGPSVRELESFVAALLGKPIPPST